MHVAGAVISGIYIPSISRIVGSSARDCARFPCYFPAAGERTGGCNPPNPPPGSAPADVDHYNTARSTTTRVRVYIA